jgi:hypothetical protein
VASAGARRQGAQVGRSRLLLFQRRRPNIRSIRPSDLGADALPSLRQAISVEKRGKANLQIRFDGGQSESLDAKPDVLAPGSKQALARLHNRTEYSKTSYSNLSPDIASSATWRIVGRRQ